MRMCCPSSNHRTPRGCPRGHTRVRQSSGALEVMCRTPASSCGFLTLPDWISWHSGQASGDRGHTHSNTVTYTKHSLSLRQPANSYASFNTQLGCYRAPPHSPPRLPTFWLPSAPLGHLLLNLIYTKWKLSTSYVSGIMLSAGIRR